MEGPRRGCGTVVVDSLATRVRREELGPHLCPKLMVWPFSEDKSQLLEPLNSKILSWAGQAQPTPNGRAGAGFS